MAPPGDSGPDRDTAPRRGALVVAMAFVLCLVNYLDRVVISFAIAPIQADFGVGNTGFGLAMSLFALGTLSTNGVAGIVLDRAGARTVWTVSLALWSVAMIGLGLVEIWALFLALRVVLGAGEGVNFPAMNRAIADWVPPHGASTAAALCLLGVPGALLLGGPLLSAAIDRFDWRHTFVGLGVIGMMLVIAWAALYRDPPRREGRRHGAAREDLLELLRSPTLLALSASFFAFGYVLFFGITWIPGYFQQTWGLDLKAIGWFSMLPWGLAVLLMPVVARISDRIMRSTGDVRRARIHPIWICQLAGALAFLPLLVVNSAAGAIACLTVAIGLSMAANGPYYSVCTDLFPRRAGTATGILVTAFSASGLVSPILTGWLSDLFGGFAAAFVALAALVGLAALGLLIVARPGPPAVDETVHPAG